MPPSSRGYRKAAASTTRTANRGIRDEERFKEAAEA